MRDVAATPEPLPTVPPRPTVPELIRELGQRMVTIGDNYYTFGPQTRPEIARAVSGLADDLCELGVL